MVITLTDTVGGLPFSGTDYNNNLATLETAFVNVPDLTAANTFTAEPHIFSATPTATANRGVVNIGGGGFTGAANHFAGSANGTLLAVNSAAAFTGNLIDAQAGGTTRFSVTAAGLVTAGDFLGFNCYLSVVRGPQSGTEALALGQNTITPGSDADVTVSSPESRDPIQVLNTGSWASGHSVILPTKTGAIYIVHNNTAFAATFKTAAGTGPSVPASKHALIRCGGANYVLVFQQA